MALDMKAFEKIVLDEANDDFEVLKAFLMDFDFDSFGTDDFLTAELFLMTHRPRIGEVLQGLSAGCLPQVQYLTKSSKTKTPTNL